MRIDAAVASILIRHRLLIMSDREFERLVTLVVTVCGENAVEWAIARALWDVAHYPVDPSLCHLIPPARRASAVQVDATLLREAITIELRRFLRPH